jgi:hypothetical protein
MPPVPWPWISAGFAVPEGNTMRNLDWQDSAICREIPPNILFPNPHEYLHKEVAQFCSGCDVRAQCAQYALDLGIYEGYWGGVPAFGRDSRRRLTAVAGGL